MPVDPPQPDDPRKHATGATYACYIEFTSRAEAWKAFVTLNQELDRPFRVKIPNSRKSYVARYTQYWPTAVPLKAEDIRIRLPNDTSLPVANPPAQQTQANALRGSGPNDDSNQETQLVALKGPGQDEPSEQRVEADSLAEPAQGDDEEQKTETSENPHDSVPAKPYFRRLRPPHWGTKLRVVGLDQPHIEPRKPDEGKPKVGNRKHQKRMARRLSEGRLRSQPASANPSQTECLALVDLTAADADAELPQSGTEATYPASPRASNEPNPLTPTSTESVPPSSVSSQPDTSFSAFDEPDASVPTFTMPDLLMSLSHAAEILTTMSKGPEPSLCLEQGQHDAKSTDSVPPSTFDASTYGSSMYNASTYNDSTSNESEQAGETKQSEATESESPPQTAVSNPSKQTPKPQNASTNPKPTKKPKARRMPG